LRNFRMLALKTSSFMGARVAVIGPTYRWPLSWGASRAQPLRQPGLTSPRFAAGCAVARHDTPHAR
jgi:hypothetical protein